MRIISDVHGNYEKYLAIANGAEYSVQLGDLGFSYCYNRLLDESMSLNVLKHKFFRGNHDDYTFENLECTHEMHTFIKARFDLFNLGEYGMREHGGVSFWFTRGAFSIDYKYRKQGMDWFPNEEIEYSLHDKIIEEYVAAKPEIVITHECPQMVGHDGLLKTDGILRSFGFDPATFNTKTGVLLQRMFEAHQPKLHIFGHYHRTWEKVINGTHFICLPEFGYLDI